jgi:hypothetical protein
MVSQKQAVTNAVLSVVPDYELGGETILSEVITESQKKEVRSIIFSGFMSGKVEMSEEGKQKYFGDEKELNKYIGGLLNNWIRKNPEFNNGGSYTVKNPGSRTGSGDEQLKALKSLLKVTTDAEVRKEIEQAITERLAEIKPAATVTINADALPAHLRHLVK